MKKGFLILLGVLGLLIQASGAPRPVDSYLRDGRIQEGLDAFASPKNNAERFSLGLLQALDGLQQFSAASTKLGVNREMISSSIPFFRVMIPIGDSPRNSNDIATPEMVAAMFQNLRDSLQKANSTLATIDDREFSVEVNLSKARLDFDGNGVVMPDEFLMTKLGPVFDISQAGTNNPDVIVHFDSADAMWLKGYTHFLTGMIDILATYDWRPVWNQCAGLIFRNPQPAPPLKPYLRGDPEQMFSNWVDLIAALHDLRLEVVDPEGLAKARKEFKAMTTCSRTCWHRVLAESDNDHEWLPSPKQTGPGGARITQAQIDGWIHILDELDAILDGKKLLPHWRMKPGIGINIPKLVASPPRLDLVLMIQGSAFVPYLEEGTVSDQATWRGLLAPYGSGFSRFAIWSQ